MTNDELVRRAVTAGGSQLWALLADMQEARIDGVSQSTVADWAAQLERAMTLRGRAIEDYVIARQNDGSAA